MKRFLTYILLTWHMTKSSIMSAMEYRTSFLLQVLGMLVNDIGLILVWVIYFKQFPTVNGWAFQDTAILFAVGTVNFSILTIFAAGIVDLAKQVANGELDYYLALPKNVLWHVSVSKTRISAIGDLIFGVCLFFLAGNVSIEKSLVFMVVSLLSAVIMFSGLVIVQSMAFFFGNFEEAAEAWFFALIGTTLYPQSVYHGALKVLLFFVLPTFFVAGLPVSLVQNFSLINLGFMAAAAVFAFILAQAVFYAGLRRYESGNLINIRSS